MDEQTNKPTVDAILANPETYGITWVRKTWGTGVGNSHTKLRGDAPCPQIVDIQTYVKHFPEKAMADANANMAVWAAPYGKKVQSKELTEDDCKRRDIELILGVNHRGGAVQRVIKVPASVDDAMMKLLASSNPGVKIIRES